MSDISASRLNNLQARIALILGNGAGQSGYGQTLASYPVSNIDGSIIRAQDLNTIYADLFRARIHQIGPIQPADFELAQVIANLNIIAENTSFEVNDDGITIVDPDGSRKGIIDYEQLMTRIETDKFLVHTTQASLEQGTTSTRTARWNGLIYHEVTVNFNSADHRRHFFNSGGDIRFTANNTSAIDKKGKDWTLLLSEIGTVIFNYNSTVTSNSGIGSGIGNYNLTSTYQPIFTKIGGGTYSGIYAGNLYTIRARSFSEKAIQFRIEFNDVVTDPPIDNNVDGRLSSIIQHYRAANTSTVSVPAPTYTTNTSL